MGVLCPVLFRFLFGCLVTGREIPHSESVAALPPSLFERWGTEGAVEEKKNKPTCKGVRPALFRSLGFGFAPGWSGAVNKPGPYE